METLQVHSSLLSVVLLDELHPGDEAAKMRAFSKRGAWGRRHAAFRTEAGNFASDLAGMPNPPGVAQHVLAHLADGRHWQGLGAKLVSARNFVPADQAAAVGRQLFGRR